MRNNTSNTISLIQINFFLSFHPCLQWRSPEEYFDNNLDEKVDVFSLGNNIYSVLTGLWVFYDEDDYWKMQHRLMDGEKAYIDPRYKERSLAEAKLVYIIDQCHEFDPEKRPSIFEVVEFLREAMEEVDEII
jgi:serine/threonine protein kinase